MLGECPSAIKPIQSGDHSYFAYFLVDNANDYFDEIKDKGAMFTSILVNHILS